MTGRCETNSICAFIAMAGFSALSLTTTLNTSPMMYSSPAAVMGESYEDYWGTTTLSPKIYELEEISSFEQAKNLFDGELRELTNEEAKKYQDSLTQIYKPIGVSIFDLC